jgi:predicted HTH domain antitoxin
MALQNFAIDLPSDILLTLNLSEKELKQQIKYALAIQSYNQLKVTIGKAAQIAELSRFEFETMLAENNVPISTLELEDVLLDVEKLI